MDKPNQTKTDNLRIVGTEAVIAPAQLISEIPASSAAESTVTEARQQAQKIIHGEDDRLLVVVGPCSIHDVDAAHEYAERLMALKEQHKANLLIIMRVYFEKPRTSIGWKGLINDPDLSGEFNINKGLKIARKLLADLGDMGMPAATEYLDLISPQYVSDLVSWAAIGARTTESQGHRELSSGVSCPIGFKNGTYGNVDIAINAIKAAKHQHTFLSVTKAGESAIFTTSGNQDCHVILRGGKRANYDSVSVEDAAKALTENDLSPYLMIDFSHANSQKDYRNQSKVCHDVANQIASGSSAVSGVMIESHLVEGNQDASRIEKSALVYGKSITDACVNWDTTETMLAELSEAVAQRRQIASA